MRSRIRCFFLAVLLVTSAFGDDQVQLDGIQRPPADSQSSGATLLVGLKFRPATPSPGLGSVKFSVTTAVDDSGKNLIDDSGWMSEGAVFGVNSVYSTSITLKNPGPQAKSLKVLAGDVEAYDPSQDPAATVEVDSFPKTYGQPVQSPALVAAGIKLTICHTPAQADTAKGSPTPAGIFSMTVETSSTVTSISSPAPPGKKKKFRKKKIQQQQPAPPAYTVIIQDSDPNQKIGSIMFEDATGNRIMENDSSTNTINADETRTYDFANPLPDTTRLTVYLHTPKTDVKIPFSFSNVALP